MKGEVVVVSFGGQYAHLIARRVRDMGVYAKVTKASQTTMADLADAQAVILSGGPASVTGKDAPTYNPGLIRTDKPTLGICYGHQLLAHALGGTVEKGETAEYGKTTISIKEKDPLFEGLEGTINAWMSHQDHVRLPPTGFAITGLTENGIVAAMRSQDGNTFGVQFHPEVTHTPQGKQIISNFIYGIAKCQKNWSIEDQIEQTLDYIGETAQGRDVITFVSGGVDSTVTATLLNKAKKTGRNIGRVCYVHVDNGLMRTNESATVVKYLKEQAGIEDVILEDASEEFLNALKGVVDPEEKRKIVGDLFVRVQSRIRERLGFGADATLCQGTLYTDLVESGRGAAGTEDKIKTHHNVGSPEIVKKRETGGLIEPLGNFYKDESRRIGLLLGLSEELIYRQPYPGPGLAIRLIGQEVTKEKLDMLRKAEDIYAEEIKKAGLDRDISQYFAAILNSKAVGVMGDGRTHQNICALRAVNTADFMTADAAEIPYEVLKKVAT